MAKVRVRPFEERDRRAVVDFLERMTSTGSQGLSEAKAAYLERDEERPGAGLVAVDDAGVVGYAGLAPSAEGDWAMEIVSIDEPAMAELVRLGMESAADAGAGHIRWWTYDADVADAPARFGFRPERTLLRMERPLPHPDPPGFPSAVEVRAFERGVDEASWLAVNNAAFAGHPENSNMDVAELERRFAYDWFEAEGLRMAWEDDDLVGFCWTKQHPDHGGEIYIIAVAPEHQGRGLGRALVLEGLRHLTERGCEYALLYTESDNRAAVSLYEVLGFAVVRAHRSFIRQLG